MKLVFGSDHAGYDLKQHLLQYAQSKGCTCLDVGTDSAADACSYVDYGLKAAQVVQKAEADLGIIACGTGIGISIAANKVAGIRCALCTNEYMARMARQHNNANMLALGGRVIGFRLAESILDAFLTQSFETGGRHQKRVDELNRLQSEN